jgi:hypothetical protein
MSECLVMGVTKMKTAHRRDKYAGGHRSTFGASETKLLLGKLHLCRACVHFTWPAQINADSRLIQTSEQRRNSLKNLMLISADASDGWTKPACLTTLFFGYRPLG